MSDKFIPSNRWESLSAQLDLNYCRSFADLFTPKYFSSLDNPTSKKRLSVLLKKSQFEIPGYQRIKIADLCDTLYSIFNRHYRCEYVYKNTIASKLLIENHSLNNSVLFTEFWVNNSKADMVVANGTTTAYEIKTDLDTLSRLNSQITSYQKLFDRVFVVTHPDITKKVKSILDNNIGIIELSENNNLRTIRKASSNIGTIEPSCIFKSLHKNEYLKIIKELTGQTLDLPNGDLYAYAKDIFCQFPSSILHRKFVEVLKRRDTHNFLKSQIHLAPYSLRALFLSNNLSMKKSLSMSRLLRTVIQI